MVPPRDDIGSTADLAIRRPSKNRIRTVVVEEKEALRARLRDMMVSSPRCELIGMTTLAGRAAEICARRGADVVLINLGLHDGSAVLCTREIRARRRSTRVVVYADGSPQGEIYRAVLAGADGYLDLRRGSAGLSHVVEAVHGGERVLPRQVSDMLLESGRGKLSLSARELDVLKLVAAGKSNREIGECLFISEGTVKTHVNSILQKLGASDRTHAVVLALKLSALRLEDLGQGIAQEEGDLSELQQHTPATRLTAFR